MFRSHQIAAIAIMSLGMMFIPLGDTAGKLLIAREGVAPIFVAWSRFGLGALMIVIAFGGRGLDASIFSDWRVWLRASLISSCVVCILTALESEPIANVFAVFFIGPIISYFGSAVLLKEPISRVRTALLFTGFCGVLLVVKPVGGVSTGILFALIAGLFYGSFLVASKWLSDIAKPRMLLLSHLTIGAVFMTPFAVAQVPGLSAPVVSLVLLSAAASALGNLLYLVANRMADASRLAPLVYVQLLSATLLGFGVFGDLPDLYSLAGLLLLLGSGLVSFLIANKAIRLA